MITSILKRTTATILFTSVTLATLAASTPTARADDGQWSSPQVGNAAPPGLDPHFPNQQYSHCPGGWAWWGGGYCDGEHYPDGTYWHQLTYMGIGRVDCVIDNGDAIPPLAPAGGCGGAVK